MKDLRDAALVGIGVGFAYADLGPSDDIGQLELVGNVLELAPELDRYYDLHFTLEDFAGCWAYDVAEAFGEWCARQMLKGEAAGTNDVQRWLEANVSPTAVREAA